MFAGPAESELPAELRHRGVQVPSGTFDRKAIPFKTATDSGLRHTPTRQGSALERFFEREPRAAPVEHGLPRHQLLQHLLTCPRHRLFGLYTPTNYCACPEFACSHSVTGQSQVLTSIVPLSCNLPDSTWTLPSNGGCSSIRPLPRHRGHSSPEPSRPVPAGLYAASHTHHASRQRSARWWTSSAITLHDDTQSERGYFGDPHLTEMVLNKGGTALVRGRHTRLAHG